MILSIILQSNSSKAQAIPGPECSKTCGNVPIRYPFGIEENCYLDTSYMVTCNTATGTARISGMSVNVVDISIEGHLRVISPVARTCYNETNKILSENPSVNLSRFPISISMNKITTLGCDTRGNIKTDQVFQAGCPTMPGSCNEIVGSCASTIGCCQGTIEPAQLTRFRFNVESNTGNVGKKDFNNCSYAFIEEDGRYNFSSINLYNLKKQDLDSYEMLLDWTVGNTSCQEAQKNISSYLCKENSNCIDVNNGVGYRCSCSVGYQGTPYLKNCCLDVDECEDDRLHSCTHLCNNTDGSYTCYCPEGYSGDGRKDGTRCTKNRTNLQKLGVYVGISMGVIVTSLTMFLSYCLFKQRRIAKKKETMFKRNGGTIFEKLLSECEGSTQIVKIFTEEELKKATNNFNSNNIVGQGAFGTVYKGILIDNTEVAIKKSKVVDPNQIGQFVNEVVLLSQINHPNIVKLVGCCLETDVPLLAYEYIVNETLYHQLHGKSHGASLTWSTRLNLAVETAGALAYMHSTTKIIHRDIKSSNILLNEDYTAKVSDFGISRSVHNNKMQVSTAVQGTIGYIDPEYFSSGILTEKSDVYSFGVVLVELLTGKKINSGANKTYRSLVDLFVVLLNEDHLNDIIDDQVKIDATADQLNRVAQIVKSCVAPEGKARPTMQQVKDELAGLQLDLGTLLHLISNFSVQLLEIKNIQTIQELRMFIGSKGCAHHEATTCAVWVVVVNTGRELKK
ncbi:wall-associated receptor kinase 3-like [Rutidosis leptorrhynchoides]|uniref:wall-associated receptor kinase 3-like n=1 Tax=Rutidosis leptorrhynchoides TaxID=125765 RepID=UPI003A9A125B